MTTGSEGTSERPKEIGKSDVYAAHKSSAFGRRGLLTEGERRAERRRHSSEIGVKAMRIRDLAKKRLDHRQSLSKSVSQVPRMAC